MAHGIFVRSGSAANLVPFIPTGRDTSATASKAHPPPSITSCSRINISRPHKPAFARAAHYFTRTLPDRPRTSSGPNKQTIIHLGSAKQKQHQQRRASEDSQLPAYASYFANRALPPTPPVETAATVKARRREFEEYGYTSLPDTPVSAMSTLQRVATDEMPIGMALGSPSQAPQYQSPRPHNLTHVQLAPPASSSRPSLASATASTSSAESHVPTPPPASRQKGKWKLFGGLFRKPPPQPQQAFYKLEPEAAQEIDPEPDWLQFPEPPAATEKERGWGRTKSERRPQTAKPKLARSATAPVEGPVVSTPPRETRRLEKRERVPVDTPMQTHVEDEWTAMTPKVNSKSDRPILAVEIPTTEMERYSVMFSSLLDKKNGTQPSTSGLLARRQATLDRLKSVNETIAELERTEQRLDAHKPTRPRRATSPNPEYSPHHSPRLSQSPRHSPSFSLFPNGATLATHPSQPNLSPTLTKHPAFHPPSPTKPAQPHRLAPKPLTRSNTSPAALTPLQESFTPLPPQPSRRHATDSETHAIVGTPTSYALPLPSQSALPANPYPRHQAETPTTPWTDGTTLLSPLSTASLPATPAVHLNARPPPQTEPEWEMVPPPTTQPETRDRSYNRYQRRYASPGSSGSSGRGSESAGTQSSVSSASSAEAETPLKGHTVSISPTEIRRKPSKQIIPISTFSQAAQPQQPDAQGQSQAHTQQQQQQQQQQHTPRRPAPPPLATMSSGSGDVRRAEREHAEPVPHVKVKGSVAVARQMSLARQRERAEAEEARGGMGVGVARQMSVSRARITTTVSAAPMGARRAGTREGHGEGTDDREREIREKAVGDAGEEGERVVGGEKIVVRNRARTVQRVVGGEGGGRKSEYGVLVG